MVRNDLTKIRSVLMAFCDTNIGARTRTSLTMSGCEPQWSDTCHLFGLLEVDIGLGRRRNCSFPSFRSGWSPKSRISISSLYQSMKVNVLFRLDLTPKWPKSLRSTINVSSCRVISNRYSALLSCMRISNDARSVGFRLPSYLMRRTFDHMRRVDLRELVMEWRSAKFTTELSIAELSESRLTMSYM